MELTLFHLSSQFSGSCLHGLSLEELPGLLWWKNSEKKQRNFCPVSMDNCWKSSSCAWEMFLEIIQKTSFVGGGAEGGLWVYYNLKVQDFLFASSDLS